LEAALSLRRGTRWSLRLVALLYLAALLVVPIVVIFIKTFENGFSTAWGYMTTPAAVSAFWLSIMMAVIAVPLNTIFGISAALTIARGRHRRVAALLDAFIDLPFMVSPVIVGLALTLVYGIHGWFGNWFEQRGVQIIFAPTGMVLATIFVSLPFVVREVTPVLVEVGDEQEQAAATLGASRWQIFRKITFPSIRWGVAYGVILSTARALGEIGAVLVVSSLVAGQTLTLPLLVYERYQTPGTASITSSYAAATELTVISLIVLLGMTVLSSRRSEA
jgi:sulfate/thiosulfate transport system permease protein